MTAYRKHCAQPGTSLGQLILPEALKILPMYICGLLKCDAIDGGPEISPDDKAYAQLKLLGSFISSSQVFLYPKLYRIEVWFLHLLHHLMIFFFSMKVNPKLIR